MHRTVRFVLLCTLARIALACGDGPAGPPAYLGSYAARVWAGDAVPYNRVDGDYRYEILSGYMSLNANGTYIASATERYTEPGEVRANIVQFSGRYRVRGTTFEYESSGIDMTGTIRGDSIVLEAYTGQFVFVR